ncbi:MAG: bifunctional 2-C-methyl-D-erythritol 4-phosphate cytidylyltransferase/2-C-methyl-D-erythritol 2,4-cyclodiphosphate synthase [Paracoccaceae bacterium]
MSTAAIIVAAGRGLRAGGGIPKQWRQLSGRTITEHALRAFQNHPRIDQLVLVVHAEDIEAAYWPSDIPAIIVTGGSTRTASVLAGLKALDDSCSRALIHDAARPCVSASLIDRVLDALITGPAAAPAVAIVDALWSGADDRVTGAVNRNGLFRAQTPQGFNRSAILAAHEAYGGDAADDVEIARTAGLDVTIVDGDEDNLKITTAQDFIRAERILRDRMDIRVGNGFDVHRFGPGDHVVLCGIKVPHDRGLQGHSDADVGMHAVTDALYGALARGDIGRHFPPSDPQWKGADSDIFLSHAVTMANEMGYRISNVDCTLICEFPKVGPHGPSMQTRMAEIMDLSTNQVSIKATTSERLGFTGRGEGIASMATVTLVPA